MAKYSTHPLKELLEMWDHHKLTPEQAIGHLFQHVAAQEQRLTTQEARLNQLEKRLPIQG